MSYLSKFTRMFMDDLSRNPDDLTIKPSFNSIESLRKEYEDMSKEELIDYIVNDIIKEYGWSLPYETEAEARKAEAEWDAEHGEEYEAAQKIREKQRERIFIKFTIF